MGRFEHQRPQTGHVRLSKVRYPITLSAIRIGLKLRVIDAVIDDLFDQVSIRINSRFVLNFGVT